MIAHHVLFWLKADITSEQKEAFRNSLQTLQAVEGVATIHVGMPAAIDRAVVDTSYTFSLIIFFEDMNAHDVYQDHPLHQAFLNEFRIYFERVVIYDSE